LVRQALTESGLLAALGATLGVLLAVWGRRYILHFLPSVSGSPFDAPERIALAFAAGVSVLSAVLFGLAPALRSTAVDPAAGLRSGSAPAMRGATLRGALVAAQVAFSVVLVALATLFGASLGELRTFDRGFTNLNAIQFGLRLSSGGAKEAFLAKIEATPGVTSVTGGNAGPYPSRMAGRSLGPVRVPGSEKTARAPGQVAIYSVADGYFKTIGGTVLFGREFDRGDAAGKRDDIAIVNQAFVLEFMPAEAHAVGRTFSFDNGRPEGGKQTRIIGVVHDIAHYGLRERAAPGVYLRTERANASFVLVATKLPPATLLHALRRDVARLGSQGIVSEPLTLSEEIDESIYQDRILAALSGCFGALALLLAAVGLYGVVAYRTLQRTTEIGVRIALGAERAGIVWLVLRNALALVALGLAVGLPVAYAAVKAAGAIVFGVKPGNPWLFAFTAVALLAAGAAAAFLPATRAAAMDPMQALRHD
jgi:predicted permease